jgi:hypothetical protein
VDFSIDPQRGLNGTCDFILSRSPEQFYITKSCQDAPLLAVGRNGILVSSTVFTS